MKALISPLEVTDVAITVAWVDGEPVLEEITDCVRIADVETEAFDVAPPFFWVDCPEECTPEHWYYKDGELLQYPVEAPNPAFFDEE